jgi:hypothetical protein
MNAPKLNEKIEDELRKTLEHIAGEMRQRIVDLEAKAERPWGGALSGRTEAAEYVAQACREANAIVEAAIAKLPAPPQAKGKTRPAAKSEPPLHPAHPDRQAGKPEPRG